MKGIDRALSVVSKGMGVVGAVAVLILLVVTSLDVLLLKLFSMPIPGASELIEVFMPFVVFGFLLEMERQKKHITVDVFSSKITRPGMKKTTDIVVDTVCLLLILIITWNIVPQALRSTAMREHVSGLIPYPVFYAKLFTAFAFFLVSVQSAIRLVRSIAHKA